MRPPVVLALLGGLAVACLLLVALVAGPVLMLVLGGPDRDDARRAADQFARRLERGEDRAAYDSLCAETRARITPTMVTAWVERRGRPVRHVVDDVVFLDEAGRDAAATVRMTDRSGRTAEVRLRLTSDAGWRVCDDTFG